MKQRSSFSIITLVLESVEESGSDGISKTMIMQRVMLNYKRPIRYFTDMLDKQLLTYDPKMHRFHITEKGKLVLRNSRELASFITPINDMMNKYRFNIEERVWKNDHYEVAA